MGLFYGYVGIVGLAVYLVLRWFKAGVGLAQVWCSYGYALAIYIPMAALCVLPMEAVRWALVGAANRGGGRGQGGAGAGSHAGAARCPGPGAETVLLSLLCLRRVI